MTAEGGNSEVIEEGDACAEPVLEPEKEGPRCEVPSACEPTQTSLLRGHHPEALSNRSQASHIETIAASIERMQLEHNCPDHNEAGTDNEDGERLPDADAIKMFVGQIPKEWNEHQCQELFAPFGQIHSLKVLRDKETGKSRGCCFVTFYTRRAALAAQDALHNMRTLEKMHNPIQMKPADSESRPERKIFVGMIAKKAGEDDVRRLFAHFGNIEECLVLRDNTGNSRGCAFVTFSTKQCAVNAIKSMNGSRTMEGCSLPLVVKLATNNHPAPLSKCPSKEQHNQLECLLHPPQMAAPAGPIVLPSGVSPLQASPQFVSLAAAAAAAMMATAASNNPALSRFSPATNYACKLKSRSLEACSQANPLLGLATAHHPKQASNLWSSSKYRAPRSHQSVSFSPYRASARQYISIPPAPAHPSHSIASVLLSSTPPASSELFACPSPYVYPSPYASGLSYLCYPGYEPAVHFPVEHYPYPGGSSSVTPTTPSSSSGSVSNGVPPSPKSESPLASSTPSSSLSLSSSASSSSSACAGSSKQVDGPEGANLFVYHLPSGEEFSDASLAGMFAPYGKIVSAKVYLDRCTNFSKGFGFVSYESACCAQRAIQEMNGFQLGNKRLKVQFRRRQTTKPY